MNNIDNDYEIFSAYQDYKNISDFTKKYNKLTMLEFDHLSATKCNLFTVKEEIDFKYLNQIIDRIIITLPSIKRIFARPYIHLKDIYEVRDAQSVRIINNNTINFLSNHSETWKDIDDDGIKPLKLLTRNYKDDYSIYENIVFCKTIDDILAFIRKNIRNIKDLIYANKTLEFDLLERKNHLNYFLALGKLRTGYIRNFNKNFDQAKSLLDKMQYIEKTIRARLQRPVYKNNKKKIKRVELHKTNVLSMHKDYHQIYSLNKFFLEKKISQEIDTNYDITLDDDYFMYVKILTIFSIFHFNYSMDKRAKIDFNKIDLKFKNDKFTLRLYENNKELNLLVIEISKDKTYKIDLILNPLKNDSQKLIDKAKKIEPANLYYIISPYEDMVLDTYISILNIDSFRRIEQIVLKGMVYACTTFDMCPFCGQNLIKQEDGSYVCQTCYTLISKEKCVTKNRFYYTTSIYNYKASKDDFYKDDWLLKRQIEASYFYRNITKIDDEYNFICPLCNNVHKTNF